MKKNTKIIIWSIVGLAIATGAFFGIRALVKKSNRSKTDTLPKPMDETTEANKTSGKAIIHGSPDAQLLQEIKDQKLIDKFK